MGADIADLKGQFNFLQLHPFTNKNFFNTHVKPAYSGSGWSRGPAYVLLFMLGQCMIRHTKLQVRHSTTVTGAEICHYCVTKGQASPDCVACSKPCHDFVNLRT